MLRLTAIVIVCALAWSAYWVYGSVRERGAVFGWFDARAAASAGTITTRGFPNRFDTTIDKPEIRLPPVAWSAPFLQLLRLSYDADHYIIAFGGPQVLTLGDEEVTVTTAEAQASAIHDGRSLDRFVLTLEAPTFTSDEGWAVSSRRLVFAARHTNDGYEVSIDLLELGQGAEVTNVHIEGVLTMPAQTPAGVLTLTASAPDIWASIAERIGLPDANVPLDLLLAGNQITYSGQPVGAIPRLP